MHLFFCHLLASHSLRDIARQTSPSRPRQADHVKQTKPARRRQTDFARQIPSESSRSLRLLPEPEPARWLESSSR